jgi:2-methylcitrate dehydratase PrpD
MDAGQPDEADGLTQLLGDQVVRSSWARLPSEAVAHSLRAFVNFMGCAFGGVRHEAVQRAWVALGDDSSTDGPIATTTPIPAPLSALLICMSASVHAFDDTHADAIVHPSSIVGSALLGLIRRRRTSVTGQLFLLAFAWGIEVACRLSKCLSVAPAQADLGWSQSGVTGAVGAAAACGKVLGLSSGGMSQALGIAASLSSGLRVAHGTMAMHLVPAQAAALGAQAALLAEAGFTGPANALEARHGFLSLFARVPHLASLTDALGVRFELMRITFKAYPCGVVNHAVIDACLALRGQTRLDIRDVLKVELRVPKVTALLCDRQRPSNELEAQVSVQHWAAVSLLQGAAGLPEGAQAMIENAEVSALRERCDVVVVPEFSSQSAAVRILRRDGTRLEKHIPCFRGSREAPLSDAAIDRKFLNQSELILGATGAKAALERCRKLATLEEVATLWPELTPDETPLPCGVKTDCNSDGRTHRWLRRI